jgi:hypothetical protein
VSLIQGDPNELARARHQSFLDEAAQHRLVKASAPQLPFPRRAARPLGRAFFQLGAWLLRYGRAEQPAALQVYQPSASSIKLN